MTARNARTALALLLLAAIAYSGGRADGAATRYQGLSLGQALQHLQGQGLKVIYSSQLVQSEMRVGAEPTATRPREILDELLAPHGLTSREGPGGVVLVVRALSRGAIRGVVRDVEGGQPLAGVRILVRETGSTVLTDGSGRFETAPLAPGQFGIEAALPHYLTQHLDTVPVAPGRATEVRFLMSSSNVAAEAIVVTANDPGSRRGSPDAAEHLTQDDINMIPKVENDPLRALGPIASVAGDEESARVRFRGATPEDTLIVLDGLELYEPFHLNERKGIFSVIDSTTVAGMDVFSGGFPAEYGGRMGGVIDLDSTLPAGGSAPTLGLGTEGLRLAGEGGFGDGGQWLASARQGHPAPLLEAMGADPSYDPRYWDVFGKARWEFGGGETILTVDVLSAFDELEGRRDSAVVTEEEPGALRSRSGGTYAWLNFEQFWSPRLYAKTQVSVARLGRNRLGSSPEVASVRDDRSTSILGLKQDWVLEDGRHVFKWGVDLKKLRAEYDYSLVPSDTGEPLAGATSTATVEARQTMVEPTGRDFAAYFADTVRLSDALTVELGLRWSTQSYAPAADATLDPRFNFAYKIGSRSALRGAWGYFHQPQRINELQVEDGVNEFFPAQRAEHRLLSFEHTLGAGVELRLNAYENRLSDLKPRYENLFDPFGSFPEAKGDRVLIDADRAQAKGIELSVRGPERRNTSWWGSYTLSSTQDEVEGELVPRSWDQRNALNWGVRYRLGRQWDLELTGTHHSGRPTTPVTAEARTQSDGTVEIVPLLGPRNSTRLPAFHRLDLRAERSFAIRGTELQVFAGVANLLDRRNVCCVRSFDFDLESDGSVTVDRQDRPGLSRLFSAGLVWRF